MSKETAPISNNVDNTKLSAKERNNVKKEEAKLLSKVKEAISGARERTKGEIIEKKLRIEINKFEKNITQKINILLIDNTEKTSKPISISTSAIKEWKQRPFPTEEQIGDRASIMASSITKLPTNNKEIISLVVESKLERGEFMYSLSKLDNGEFELKSYSSENKDNLLKRKASSNDLEMFDKSLELAIAEIIPRQSHNY